MTNTPNDPLADVVLDDDITAEDLERFGADSRPEEEVDLEALEAQAIADAGLEVPDDDEEETP